MDTVTKHNILITSAGRRVELVQAFQCELKRFSIDASVFATDMCPELSSACQCADASFSVPRVTDKEYIRELLQLCEEYSIGLVVPTIDTELRVLAEHREEYSEHGVHVANVVIDGLIDSPGTRALPNAKAQPDILMNPVKIAEAFYYLHTQDRSCWTHELQLTPFLMKPGF